MLDMESAAKQAVKEMTEDDKALLALFEEYRRTPTVGTRGYRYDRLS